MSRRITTVATVEDEPETVWDYIAELEVAGLTILRAVTTPEAEELALSREADLWLVDMRLSSGSKMSFTGGVEFIDKLKSGEFGERNRGAYFAIVTAYVSDISADRFEGVPGFLGVFSKMLQTAEFIEQLQVRSGSYFAAQKGESTTEYLVEDLVEIETVPDAEGMVNVTVPAWPLTDRVKVPTRNLPFSVLTELEFSQGLFPTVFAWATVNIAAKSAGEVAPRDFHLYEESPEDQDAFDWAPSA